MKHVPIRYEVDGMGIMAHVRIVAITSVSGGGKTAVTRRLASTLGDAVAIHYDDYDDTNIHPDDLQRWSKDGGDYDAYETPLFTGHLQALKVGRSIRYPTDGVTVGPAKYVVADAPLGRAQSDSGRLIDLSVFIDTPLDIAMARRILRDIELVDGPLQHVKTELSGYETRARPIYRHFQKRMREGSDLIVDGILGIDLIVEKIRSEMELVWGESPDPE